MEFKGTKNKQHGITLIELMIVIAIIGILAAVAIPSYRDYLARSQVSESLSMLSYLKSPMAEYYGDVGRWPTEVATVGSIFSGKYVASITVATGAGIAGTLVLRARMRSTGIHPDITGKTVTLVTLDGGHSWQCNPSGNAGDMPQEYLVGACK